MSTPRAEGFSIRQFLHHQAFGGILLLVCAIVAFAWANSPWRDAYTDLWHTELTLGTVHLNLSESLLHWVNDGLMAIFFLMVGLEIKREVLVGELASPRRAALPAFAALGGVIVPAGIYLLLNRGQPGEHGWGIPMATDIAFALGVLALLGSRVPIGLKIFLAALAIVDDIMAVLVIAFFYTSRIDWISLGQAGLVLAGLILINRLGIRRFWAYAVLGLLLWITVFNSGVHATVAGVLFAFTIPAGTRVNPVEFVKKGRELLDRFEAAGSDTEHLLANGERQEVLAELEQTAEEAGSLLHRMEHALHPVVTFIIVPLFALANAGVHIEGSLGDALTDRVTLGVILGLVLGKQIGVTLATLIAVKSKIAVLPEGVSWAHIYGAGWLAGIGFTMSLFVADLAFASDELLASAKLGILCASLIAGSVGYLLLRLIDRKRTTAPESTE